MKQEKLKILILMGSFFALVAISITLICAVAIKPEQPNKEDIYIYEYNLYTNKDSAEAGLDDGWAKDEVGYYKTGTNDYELYENSGVLDTKTSDGDYIYIAYRLKLVITDR